MIQLPLRFLYHLFNLQAEFVEFSKGGHLKGRYHEDNPFPFGAIRAYGYQGWGLEGPPPPKGCLYITTYLETDKPPPMGLIHVLFADVDSVQKCHAPNPRGISMQKTLADFIVKYMYFPHIGGDSWPLIWRDAR